MASSEVTQKPLVDEKGQNENKMRVMVAIDESEVSLYALRWALDHVFGLKQEQGGMITLVHVQEPYHYEHVIYHGRGGAGINFFVILCS